MQKKTKAEPSSNEPTRPAKKKYEKPVIHSESLTAVAALCNGTSAGGRKASTPVCTANRLKS